MNTLYLAALSLILTVAAGLPAEPSTGLFPPEVKRVVFLGDSITYSGQYVDYVVAYHRARYPQREIEFINVGLPSETASGLSEPEHLTRHKFARPDLHERLARVLERTRPDLVFACYGMNDGIYLPLDETRFRAFQESIRWLRTEVQKTGAKIINVTPPVFDDIKGGKPGYGAVLDTYSRWLLDQRSNGWQVVDVHFPMKRHLEEQRAQNPDYNFSGDGVHPNDAGHWLMAQAILLHLGVAEAAQATCAEDLLARIPNGPATLQRERKEMAQWKDAWLTAIGHQRPGMRKGLPLEIDPTTGRARLVEETKTAAPATQPPQR